MDILVVVMKIALNIAVVYLAVTITGNWLSRREWFKESMRRKYDR